MVLPTKIKDIYQKRITFAKKITKKRKVFVILATEWIEL